MPSYGGCQYVTMFTDDMTRMRRAIPMKTKDEAVDALRLLVREVADPEGISIGTIRCDGGGEFQGMFENLAKSLGIKVTTNAPYVPQGNAVAERSFGTVIGVARCLMLGAPHVPPKLWPEAVKPPSTSAIGRPPTYLEVKRLLNCG